MATFFTIVITTLWAMSITGFGIALVFGEGK